MTDPEDDLGTVRWFGEPWPEDWRERGRAPVCDDERTHVETPVGMRCFGHDHMHTPNRPARIQPGDQGITMPYLDRRCGGEGDSLAVYHLACWLHEIGADRL